LLENRALKRMFVPKRDEVTGGWRKLRNLYSSPLIIKMIKLRRMRWAGHAARMEMRNTYKMLVRNSEGKRPLGKLDLDERILLK
jgi:hypothetical protein